jgi:nucleoside-diphosphate-sugar epimerase
MKVCVVGGNGNIGYSVAKQLLIQGHDVTCYNRGLSGKIPEGARWIRCDRYDRGNFERKIKKEKFDAAIDMLCYNHEDALSSVRAFRGVGHIVICSSVATFGREFDYLPVEEDHPLRPWTDSEYGVGKAKADEVFWEAFKQGDFPVTLIKPSITYGTKLGIIRQIDNSPIWISRIRKGLPIVVSGDGVAMHQFMHVDDAGLAFALVLGREYSIGQVYNLVHKSFTSWDIYHRTVMKVVGREVEMIGVPSKTIFALKKTGFLNISDVFSHNSWFSGEKLHKDIPEFKENVSLEEGIRKVLIEMDKLGLIPDAEIGGWEDKLIDTQRGVDLMVGTTTSFNIMGFLKSALQR